MRKKRAQINYFILSFILAIIVLGIVVFFLFNEYWNESDSSREICAQSILLRASAPNIEYSKVNWESFKDDFPLKCSTQVVDIDVADLEKNQVGMKNKIGYALADCWALYGEGNWDVFPSKVWKSSACAPCARIHLTDDAVKYAESNKIDKVSIKESLDEKMDPQYTYYAYLQNVGRFPALSFGGGVEFNISGESFSLVDNTNWLWKKVDLVNREDRASRSALMASQEVNLPEYFYIGKGDLLINYGSVAFGDEDFADTVPYLFYFQSGQEKNPFIEVKEKFIATPGKNVLTIIGSLLDPSPVYKVSKDKEGQVIVKAIPDASRPTNLPFCQSWEGIPA